jgi:anti-sigma-K factor RskA
MIEQLGAVPEPVEVTYNNPKVAMASQELSAKLGTWDAAGASLKTFAHMAVAAFRSATLWLNGAPAGVIEVAGERAAVSLVVEDGLVARVYLVRNPLKLTRLDEPADLAR